MNTKRDIVVHDNQTTILMHVFHSIAIIIPAVDVFRQYAE